MTAPAIEKFELTLEQVAKLRANDVGIGVTVAMSGTYLDDYYKEHGRLDYHNGAKGRFWDKVHEIVDILETADTWPFEPVSISKDAKVLYDGYQLPFGDTHLDGVRFDSWFIEEVSE